MTPFIIALILIDVYINILLYQNNKKLTAEVREIKKWCVDELSKIIEEEEKIDKDLDRAIDKIEKNQVAKDLDEIMHFEGRCQYHEKVMQDYAEYKEKMIGDICEIKHRKCELLENVKADMEKTQPEED